MKVVEARELVRGQEVLAGGKPARFVAVHQVQNRPGRYSYRVLVEQLEAGRVREISYRAAQVEAP